MQKDRKVYVNISNIRFLCVYLTVACVYSKYLLLNRCQIVNSRQYSF